MYCTTRLAAVSDEWTNVSRWLRERAAVAAGVVQYRIWAQQDVFELRLLLVHLFDRFGASTAARSGVLAGQPARSIPEPLSAKATAAASAGTRGRRGDAQSPSRERCSRQQRAHLL
jgi:hypothetical protein